MPFYFIIFLAILASALLLYVSAVAYVAILRRPPKTIISGFLAEAFQVAGVALLWFSVGVCWLLFFNVYCIHVDMSALSDAAFQAFARGYTKRLPIVVLPYGVTCLLWTLALWSAPGRISRRAIWGIATLCILSIASTPWAAGALDSMHDHGYTPEAYLQLRTAHLIRTLALTFAAVWALAQNWRLPEPSVPAQKS